MSDAETSARGAALRAWMVEAERVAATSELGLAPAHIPAPPGNLTPQDYLAAGFELHAAGRGRKEEAGSRFHVNCSADLRNQALLLCGPPESRLARLWMDGHALQVPLDRKGVPICDALVRWLDSYVSTGLLQRTPTPVRAASLRLWRTQIWHIASQGPASFTQAYPPPPAPFGPDDCRAISFGFLYEHDEHFAYEYLDEKGEAPLNIVFSPDLGSQAVLLKGSADWSGSLLWVDGHEVPVRRSDSGDPQCESLGTWLSNRFLCAEVGGLWDHPLADPTVPDSLGKIRGLLLWDNERRVTETFLPKGTEAWTSPAIVRRDNAWHIFPDRDAVKQDRPDRIVPMSD